MDKSNPKEIKGLSKLKGVAALILNFELEKYKTFQDIGNSDDWNDIYVNDTRYELIRLVMLTCWIQKGFFTMSDLTGITNLNTRSIERLISRSTQQGYYIKKPGKDKRVVEYFPTDRSFGLIKAHFDVLDKVMFMIGDDANIFFDKAGISREEIDETLNNLMSD